MRTLAFYHGWWGVRPKSPVTSQPPRLVDLLYREDPHILCFREACRRPSVPSLFGMPYGHSLSCLLIRRYHMSAVTFLFTTMCSTIPTSPALTPVSPHGAAGQQKQTPLLYREDARCSWTAKVPPSLPGQPMYLSLVHGWLQHSGAQHGCLGCIKAPVRPRPSVHASLAPRSVRG